MAFESTLQQHNSIYIPNGREQWEAQNEQMASDLHTLLSSFPYGEQRRQALAQFPEIEEGFKVRWAIIPNPDSDPYESGLMLYDMVERATAMVGGDANKALILNYPGVTTDQGLTEVRPLRKNWQEVNDAANSHGPQFGTIIYARVGQQVFQDIQAGTASWRDVVYGYLDKDQIIAQKELVAKLHTAFRTAPAMPAGHQHEHSLYTIPDARFGHLWRVGARHLVRMGMDLAAWVERAEGVTLPSAPAPQAAWEVTTIDPSSIQRLDALFNSRRYKPYVDTYLSLYAAVNAGIDSEEGRKVLAYYRQQFNSRKVTEPDETAADDVNEFVRQCASDQIALLTKTPGTLPLPDDLAVTFMKNLQF